LQRDGTSTLTTKLLCCLFFGIGAERDLANMHGRVADCGIFEERILMGTFWLQCKEVTRESTELYSFFFYKKGFCFVIKGKLRAHTELLLGEGKRRQWKM